MHMNQANLRLKLQRMGAHWWPLDLQLTDQAEADIKQQHINDTKTKELLYGQWTLQTWTD